MNTTPQESEAAWQELEEFAASSASVMHSRWQPCIVTEAFTRPPLVVRHGQIDDPLRPGYLQRPWRIGPLTMRAWLELDRVRSPFLSHEDIPLDELPERLAEAVRALTGEVVTAGNIMAALPGDGGVELARAFHALCAEPTLFHIPMERDEPQDRPASPPREDGFGGWLPMLAAIVERLHLTPEQAMEMPVAQAVALLHALKKNDGMRARGETYRSRELAQTPAPQPAQKEEK